MIVGQLHLKSVAIVRRLFRGLLESSLFVTRLIRFFVRPVFGRPDFRLTKSKPDFLYRCNQRSIVLRWTLFANILAISGAFHHSCNGTRRHLVGHDFSPCLNVIESNEINSVLSVQ